MKKSKKRKFERKAGRPRGSSSLSRDDIRTAFPLRMNAAERRIVAAKAVGAGLPVSVWIRSVLLRDDIV